MILKGKVALITGSAKGLGKMTALTLASSGCDVVVNYLTSESAAHELVKQIEGLGVRAIAVRADITKRDQLNKMVLEVKQRLGTIDILINNAGPFIRERRLFADYKENEIEYLIQGNLLSSLFLDHLVLPTMRERGWGRIIHFGFGQASEARGWAHRAVYAAAKVGLVSFTKTLAEEEAKHGITVNMICPGDIRGDHKEQLIQEVAHLNDEELPGKRPGAGEDVSRVISFLCQPESDFLTGNIIDVSGGFNPIRSLPIR